MYLKKEQASSVLALIGMAGDSKNLTDEQKTLILSINSEYPELIRGTVYAKVIEDTQREKENLRRSAVQRIAELSEQAMALIREAEDIADTNNVGFTFNIEYGMGGYYEPNEGWNSSSNDC